MSESESLEDVIARERAEFIELARASLLRRKGNSTAAKRKLFERLRQKITVTPDVARIADWNAAHRDRAPLPLNRSERRRIEATERARARAVRRALPHWLMAWGRAVAKLAA